MFFATSSDNKRKQRKIICMYRKYGRELYNIAYKYLNDPMQTEDMIQDTFLKVIKSKGNLNFDVSNLMPLLIVIMTNTIRDYFRSSASAKHVPFNEELIGHRSVPDTMAEELHLKECIAKLDERQRRLLYLRHYIGLSCKEIGEEMGLSAEYVKKLIQAAKAQLLKLYNEGDDE